METGEAVIPESEQTPEDNVTATAQPIESPKFKVGDRVHYNGAGWYYGAPKREADGVVTAVSAVDYEVVFGPDIGEWFIKPEDLAFVLSPTEDSIREKLDDIRSQIESIISRETKPTFNRAVDEAFALSQSISNQRGGEYQDSWAIENQSTHFLDATLRLVEEVESPLNIDEISKEAKRLLMLASMCDVKVSRMGGAWKGDTFEDLLNYVAAYTTLAKEYQAPDAA